jgi:anthranilate/para-aminobenzoate synthase component I
MKPQNTRPYSIVYLNKGDEFLKFSNASSGFAYYKNYRINLLDGSLENWSIEKLEKRLEKIKLSDSFTNPTILHLFYEYGFNFTGNESLIGDEDLLLIELNYDLVTPYTLESGKKNKIKGPLKNIKLGDYKKSFDEGRDHLLKGNCYQFNLTFQHKYSLEGGPNEILSSLWSKKENRGAYAHASVIPYLSKLYVSNSPECLFQIKSKKAGHLLWSMPIKGSEVLGKNPQDSWRKLKACPKNQAELYMITDLLRNDLSKIEKPKAQVIKKKSPLRVPGILHQFSLVSVLLNKNTSLYKVISSLFPGGSVTGAPKKRVMEILNDLEFSGKRGFYCGSTIILYKNLKAASINIRSATIDLNSGEFIYGSGGGVTLLSQVEDEYKEMKLKIGSFINILS